MTNVAVFCWKEGVIWGHSTLKYWLSLQNFLHGLLMPCNQPIPYLNIHHQGMAGMTFHMSLSVTMMFETPPSSITNNLMTTTGMINCHLHHCSFPCLMNSVNYVLTLMLKQPNLLQQMGGGGGGGGGVVKNDDLSMFEDAREDLHDNDELSVNIGELIDPCVFQANLHCMVLRSNTDSDKEKTISHGPKQVTPMPHNYDSLHPAMLCLATDQCHRDDV